VGITLTTCEIGETVGADAMLRRIDDVKFRYPLDE